MTTESLMGPLLGILFMDAMNDWVEARFWSSASRETPSKRYLIMLLARMGALMGLFIICAVQGTRG